MIYSGPVCRTAAALLLLLVASACSPEQAAPKGEPGSLVVHMGGSFTSYGAVSSSSR